MKRYKIHYLLLMAIGLACSSPLFAQKDLQISKVFEQYGKKKGSTMVELSNEALGDYDFTLFKSILIKHDPSAAQFIRSCLSKDESGAKKIKQVVANGIPTSMYLQLPRKGKDNRLILFNESMTDKQLTLIYIETRSEPEQVFRLLLKKK